MFEESFTTHELPKADRVRRCLVRQAASSASTSPSSLKTRPPTSLFPFASVSACSNVLARKPRQRKRKKLRQRVRPLTALAPANNLLSQQLRLRRSRCEAGLRAAVNTCPQLIVFNNSTSIVAFMQLVACYNASAVTGLEQNRPKRAETNVYYF